MHMAVCSSLYFALDHFHEKSLKNTKLTHGNEQTEDSDLYF